MSLKGKSAIVTGGNTGIGKAIVLALAEQGANVCIDYVANEQATEELEKRIVGLGDQAIGVDADVSKIADLQMMIDETVKAFGRLDVMVNNAGVTRDATMRTMTEEQFDEVIDIHLKGCWNGTRLAGAMMRERKSGSRAREARGRSRRRTASLICSPLMCSPTRSSRRS